MPAPRRQREYPEQHNVTLVAANDNARIRPRKRAGRIEETQTLIARIIVGTAFYLAIGYGVWTYFAT